MLPKKLRWIFLPVLILILIPIILGALKSDAPTADPSKPAEVNNPPIVQKVIILTDGTNLRETPSLKGKVIVKGKKGDSFPILSRSGNWYRIDIGQGQTAYVANWVVAVAGSVDMASKKGVGGKIIVIDPGHGGKDGGTNGVKTEALEKDLNLKVALLLEKKLLDEGAIVILTRRSDIFLSLEERVSIAQEANADLFISIHHNRYDTSSMNGTITFYYDEGIEKELASKIQAELVKENGMKDLGERFGDYYVLRENRVPGVIVELGFLSNPKDEAKLISPEIQEKEAEGIKNGIISFFR